MIRGLDTIEGLRTEVESTRRIGDEVGVTAYGTDAALEAARARGLTVDVIMNNEQLAAHDAKVRSQIQDVPSARAADPIPTKSVGKKPGE